MGPVQAPPPTSIPHLPEGDSALAFLREGYNFVSRRCERLGSDAFSTTILGRPVVCARGREAARMFSHPGRFTRRGATPPTVTRLLQGRHSVHQLDGTAHHQRKALYMQLLDAGATARLVELFSRQWRARTAAWPRRPEVELQTEAERALAAAAFRWAGVPAPATEAGIAGRTRELAAMIEGAGSLGPRLVRGLRLRRRHEKRIRALVQSLRDAPGPQLDSPAALVARLRDEYGTLLPVQQAANALTNLLMPTVAMGRWITFAALALHRHPELRGRFAEPGYLQRFVHEVRRFYPFVPALAGRVREPFDWAGRRFEAGDLVLLDLYGTNRHPALWEEPGRFNPDRFIGWNGDPHGFIPQGAGDYLEDHRCPGENPTIALMMAALGHLLELDYSVPRQDLRIPMNRFPTGPRSRLILGRARPARPAHAAVAATA